MNRKKICKHSKLNTALVDENDTDSLQMASVDYINKILHLPEILESVLRNLPAKYLNTCARVNKQWFAAVRKAKRNRMHITCMLHEGEEILERVNDSLKNLSSEPSTMVGFYSSYFTDEAGSEQSNSWEYVRSVLPANCTLAAVTTDGVTGTSIDMKSTKEVENYAAMSCVLFPQLPGLDIKTFLIADATCIGERHAATDTPQPDPDESTWQAHTQCSPDDPVKLILLFYTEYNLPAELEMGYTFMKMYPNAVVAGGFVDRLMEEYSDFKSDEGEPFLRGITFSGNDIKVASVLLKSSVRTPSNVQQKLKLLQDANIPDVNRIAFQFSCIGRGSYHYGKQNVEADMFRKLFPNVPLQGFFGNGEIGYDFLPNYSHADPYESVKFNRAEKKVHQNGQIKWTFPKLHHSYTTVFVLMSLGLLKA